MQLDALDREIILLLGEDARATYSEISKKVGVSVGTVRNRITIMRDSGALRLNVWLDPSRVGGLGMTATFLIRVQAGAVDAVAEAIGQLDSTGYVAAIAGNHDLMVDAFFRDVQHLDRILHDEIQGIPEVVSVTTYLVTDVKHDYALNIKSVMSGFAAEFAPASRQGRSR